MEVASKGRGRGSCNEVARPIVTLVAFSKRIAATSDRDCDAASGCDDAHDEKVALEKKCSRKLPNPDLLDRFCEAWRPSMRTRGRGKASKHKPLLVGCFFGCSSKFVLGVRNVDVPVPERPYLAAWNNSYAASASVLAAKHSRCVCDENMKQLLGGNYADSGANGRNRTLAVQAASLWTRSFSRHLDAGHRQYFRRAASVETTLASLKVSGCDLM
jgi:hypothetical protein